MDGEIMRFVLVALLSVGLSFNAAPPASAMWPFPEAPKPVHKHHRHHHPVTVAPVHRMKAAAGACANPGAFASVNSPDVAAVLRFLCDASGGGAPVAGPGITINGNTISLANPTTTVIGGVKSHAAVAGQFLTAIGTDGTPAAATLPVPTATALGGVKDHVAVTGFYITGIDATGTPTASTTAGVTCPAGVPTATFTVTNGIVTAC